jgi:hypothetical protein
MTEDIASMHLEALTDLNNEASQIVSHPYRIIALAQIATGMRLASMAQTLEEIRDLLVASNNWVYSTANHEFITDVPAWLETMADFHIRQPEPMLNGFVGQEALAPPVIAVFVKPTIQDQDGVGQVEFTATTATGEKAQTTRVVPLPG